MRLFSIELPNLCGRGAEMRGSVGTVLLSITGRLPLPDHIKTLIFYQAVFILFEGDRVSFL